MQKEKTEHVHREAGWFFGTMCTVAGGMFIVGYIVGQRNALNRFLYTIEEQSFADKITYSFYSMNGQELPDDEDGDEQPERTVGNIDLRKNEIDSVELEITTDISSGDQETSDKNNIAVIDQDEQNEKTVYYAPLIGFGTLRAADHCAQKLKKMGIDAHLEERTSSGHRGKKIIWYQIVTEDYTDKDALEKVVERVRQELTIKEISIFEKRKANQG